MKPRLIVLVIAALVLASCAKVVVVPIGINPDKVSNDPKMTADGIFYALPKTVVRVGVKVDHTVAKAAPYMKFAAIFAPSGEKACDESKCEEKYELQQGASFTTFGEPDPANVYMVKFVGGGAIDQTVSMTWNDTGLLSATSASVTNRTTDVAISGLKLAASIGTKAAFGAAAKPKVKGKEVESCQNPAPLNDQWIIPILREGAESLVVNYCDMKVDDRNTQFSKKSDKESLALATSAYVNHVSPIVKARDSVLTGGSQSMEPAKLVDRLETLLAQRLSELYLGTKKKETWDGTLEIRKLETGKMIPILHLDPAKGICIDQAELAPDSKPCPEKWILKGDACQRATAVNLAIDYYPAEKNQLFRIVQDNTAKPSGVRSFRYRIPGQVKAKLKDAEKTYGVGVFSIAQLGTVASLPAERISKTMSYDLAFMEATGGLKSFKLGTTGALDSATVDALSGISGTIQDARNNASKSEQSSKDEVTVLTRQNTLLKLKDEICEIQKKYGLSCTVQP